MQATKTELFFWATQRCAYLEKTQFQSPEHNRFIMIVNDLSEKMSDEDLEQFKQEVDTRHAFYLKTHQMNIR